MIFVFDHVNSGVRGRIFDKQQWSGIRLGEFAAKKCEEKVRLLDDTNAHVFSSLLCNQRGIRTFVCGDIAT